jgi:hypothetical protein
VGREVTTMSLLKGMKDTTTRALTENGAETFDTTLNAVLDLFAMGGALRTRQEKEVTELFVKAYSAEPTYALKCLFFIRDIRGGQGERKTFRTIMKYMADNHSDKIMHLLHLIPEYGRYDDLYCFVGTPLEHNAFQHLKNAALGTNGVEKDPVVFKWLKSCNTSSKESNRLGNITRKRFGMEAKEYRQFLTAGRALVKGLVEIPMSKKEFGSIDYSIVPSRASMKYRSAFLRNDEVRYRQFLDKVTKGEAKINAGTLYPSDLVHKVRHERNATLEALWKALPNYVQKEQNALVMADVSGSMTQGYGQSVEPIDVSVGLAIYFAEKNKGAFANHYLTFSSVPKIQEIQGISLAEKVAFVMHTNVGYDTNLQAAFDLVLQTAIKNKLPQSDMPSTIYVISDMEFNDSQVGGLTNHEVIKLKYAQAGYKMPQLVYWSVSSRQNNLPVRYDEDGVCLVSGYSPVLFKQVVEGKTPIELMKQVLDSKRYEPVYCNL